MTDKPTATAPPAVSLTPEQRAEAARIARLSKRERIELARQDARRRRVEAGLPERADDED